MFFTQKKVILSFNTQLFSRYINTIFANFYYVVKFLSGCSIFNYNTYELNLITEITIIVIIIITYVEHQTFLELKTRCSNLIIFKCI